LKELPITLTVAQIIHLVCHWRNYPLP